MRLLLLEDHSTLAEAITSHLKSKGFSVDSATTIHTADTALRVGDFDAAIFDLSLPDGDGISLLIEIRKQGNQLPVIIMTARDQISDRIKGLDSGADDYVIKPIDLNELVARLHAVLRRYSGNPNPLIKVGNFEIDQNGHRILLDGNDLHLTAREWALVEKLMARPYSIVHKEKLNEALYGFQDEVASNTLEVYVSRLRKKMGKDTIQTVRGLGYRFVVGNG